MTTAMVGISEWLLLTITVGLVSVLFLFRGKNKTTEIKLPPSPSGLPIIGNLHQLDSFPHRSFKKLSDKYGPIMLLKIGEISTVVVSSPEYAREVLRTHDHAFAERPTFKAAEILLYGQNNVSFSRYGEQWRKVRKISLVHLLSANKVQSFRKTRHEELIVMIQKVRKSAAAAGNGVSSEAVVELSDILYDMVSNNMIRSATGSPLGDRSSTERFKALVDEAAAMLKGFQIENVFPSLGWIGTITGLDKGLRELFRRIDDFLTEMIDDHTAGGGDFVDVLLSLRTDPTNTDLHLSKDGIKSLIMDMNGSGSDTTSGFLEWGMTELIRHPKVMAKVKQEMYQKLTPTNQMGEFLVTEDDVGKLEYFKAVVKEIFRVHLPSPLHLPHESMEERTVLGGYTIPKKTRIVVNAWAIARDPKYWVSPEEFRPERFLEEESGVDYKGQDFKFLPFGSGRRGCPGMQFAIAVGELALANLIYHFDWSLPGGRPAEDLDVDEVPGIIVKRANPLRVVAKETRPLLESIMSFS